MCNVLDAREVRCSSEGLVAFVSTISEFTSNCEEIYAECSHQTIEELILDDNISMKEDEIGDDL